MRHTVMVMLVTLAAAALGSAASAENAPPRLSLPISCAPGETCFIQSYVDIVPGSEVGDYRCGSATYDGHKGVDFRLLSVAAAKLGVNVLAAAEGVVKGVRDGMADELSQAGERKAIKGRECGNGVVIDHGAGWETQYCHMRRGSVAVRSGDKVARGQVLGGVGYSGLAELAHVHLSVRHNGEVVDPYSGRRTGSPCLQSTEAAAAGSMWDEAARAAFAYRNGDIIGAGFAAKPVGWAELEVDHRIAAPEADSPSLIFYARLVNLRAGDRVRISVVGPQRFDVTSESEPLAGNKAAYVAFAGKRLKAPRWPAGRYLARVELLRAGEVVARRDGVALDLP